MTQKTGRKKGRPQPKRKSVTAKKRLKKTAKGLPPVIPTIEVEPVKPMDFSIFESTTYTMSVPEAARRLGIGKNAAYALVAEGRIPVIAGCGRLKRVPIFKWPETVASLVAPPPERYEKKSTPKKLSDTSNVIPISGRPRRR